MANAKNTLSAHTPGPWKIDTLGSHIWILSETGDYLAEVITSDEEGRCRPEDAEANARLMAAAPELLAAAEEALLILKQLKTDEWAFDDSPIEEQLQDAIAKAQNS